MVAHVRQQLSLQIYGVIYKGLTTNITTCPDYPRCNFNCEWVYVDGGELFLILKKKQKIIFYTNIYKNFKNV